MIVAREIFNIGKNLDLIIGIELRSGNFYPFAQLANNENASIYFTPEEWTFFTKVVLKTTIDYFELKIGFNCSVRFLNKEIKYVNKLSDEILLIICQRLYRTDRSLSPGNVFACHSNMRNTYRRSEESAIG